MMFEISSSIEILYAGPLIPIIPAILAFTGTIIQAALEKTPKVPEPQRLDPIDIDQELRDAQKRKGRQILAGDQPLIGGSIGAERNFGVESTILGNP